MLQSLIDIFKYESLWHKAEFAVFFVSAYALVTFVRFPLLTIRDRNLFPFFQITTLLRCLQGSAMEEAVGISFADLVIGSLL